MKTKVLHSFSSSASLSSLSHSNSTQNFGQDDLQKYERDENTGRVADCANICKKTFRRQNIAKAFPILKWGPLYDKEKFISDLIAGITVGLTILPQGLAYATIAGLPPIYGLYSGFVGCFIYIFLGGTKAITIGPTAIQMLLTNKYTHGRSPEYAVFLCFFSGLFTTALAVFKLGFIANFISLPVISGFTSAVAITIAATQLKAHLGVKFEGEGFMPTVIGLYEHLGDTKKWDAILSLICCSLYLFLKYVQLYFKCVTKHCPAMDKALWLLSISRSAIIMIGATVLAGTMENNPFSLVGYIKPGLPTFKLPPFQIFDPSDNQTHYLGDIIKEEGWFAIPILGILGHITIAKAVAGPSDAVDPGQEIWAIGITNLIGCFMESMPVSGSFSRTTVNHQSGVSSPLGGLYTGVMVLLALQFLTPYFFFIPKAALASVVSMSVIFMVDLAIIKPMWKSKRADLIPWGVTTGVTLFVGLEMGIMVGLVISACFLLYYAARPRIKIMKGYTSQNKEFLVVDLDRSLTFPSVDYVTGTLGKSVVRWGNSTTPIVIDCHHIQYCDYTAAASMRDMVYSFEKENFRVIFWKVKPSVLRILDAVMKSNGTTFFYCQSEEDMEKLVDGKYHNNSIEVNGLETTSQL